MFKEYSFIRLSTSPRAEKRVSGGAEDCPQWENHPDR